MNFKEQKKQNLHKQMICILSKFLYFDGSDVIIKIIEYPMSRESYK